MDEQVLFQHLGGNKFFVMTGAKAEVKGPDYVKFKLPKNATKANCLIIRLVNDLYNLEFIKIKKFDFETVSVIEGVYDASLRDTFERATGLYTRL